ncbi:hypothetical protein [Geobacillus thermocatenulatus]|uniref:hypothetical protein n=1 Tax=Geobacillus thermocatenulatus TaxID=33938 RepID=UPI0012DEBEFA|nr:hypothetical protein [Geobacillus thermocatenulatus]
MKKRRFVAADGTFQKEKPVGCCTRFDDKSAWTKRWTEERLVDEEEVYRGFRRMPPGWGDDSRKSSLKTKGRPFAQRGGCHRANRKGSLPH